MRKLLSVLVAVVVAAATVAAVPANARDERWVAAWGAPMTGGPAPVGQGGTPVPAGATVRNVARVAVGGSQLRVTLSNPFEGPDLVIATVAIVPAAADGPQAAGEPVVVTFGGSPTVTVPAGTDLLVSDPVALPTVDGARLFVDVTMEADGHGNAYAAAWTPSYLGSGGAFATVPALAASTYAVTGVDVLTDRVKGAVVALGSSTFQGWLTPPGSRSGVVDLLADRFAALDPKVRRSVVNAGIGGNTLTSKGTGPNGRDRFERDVLSRPGVTDVIIYDTNDIAFGTGNEAIMDAYRDLAARASARGIRVWCPTWLPRKGDLFGTAGVYTLQGGPGNTSSLDQTQRNELNDWLLSKASPCDGAVDWDAALRWSVDPDMYDPRYDGGDHVHPNVLGHQELARTFPVEELARRGSPR